MRLCSKCGADTADACDICGICGATVDEVEPADRPLEVPAEAPIVDSPVRPRPRQVPVGMPRRFSIGTMMILVTAFAMLFGVLKSLDASPAGFVAISIFIGGVAACQAILFKGKRPRLASLVSGIVLSYLIGIVAMGVQCFTNQGWYNIWDFTAMLFGVVLSAMFLGGPLGYAIGCMVAAIFLVRKEPDDGEPTAEEQCLEPGDRADTSMSEHLPQSGFPRKLSLKKLVRAWQEEGNLVCRTMWQCSKCGAETADAHETCGICGAPMNGVVSTDRPLEVPVETKILDWLFGLKLPQNPVGMPRRFGIGTMMILTAAFALLFGVLKTFGADPAVFAAISIFIAGVAACQAVLFKGKNPRLASFVGGILVLSLIAVVGVPVDCHQEGLGLLQTVVFTVLAVILSALLGGPLGYAAGCVAAAIFLVRKEPDDAEESTKHSP